MEDLQQRLDLICHKRLELQPDAVNTPHWIELEKRILRIDSILTDKLHLNFDDKIDHLLLKSPMHLNELFFEVFRCECLIDKIEKNKFICQSVYVTPLVFPTAGLAFIQKVIQSILWIKNALSISKTVYRSWSIWQLLYLKNDIQISFMIRKLFLKLPGTQKRYFESRTRYEEKK